MNRRSIIPSASRRTLNSSAVVEIGVGLRPLRDRESEFERAYGPSGEWTQLFQHGEGYLGTELLQRSDDPREYLVLDRWASRAAYEVFRARFSSEYRQLDRRLEELTEEEAPMGTFETLSP